jgi:hypothetical protein
MLYFSRAELKPQDLPTAAFVFRELKHPPSDTPSSGRRINVHATQFHRVVGGAFEAERADHFVAHDGNPKTAIALAVIRRYTIDFFRQRALNIHLKGVTEVGRAEESVDSNEQLPHVSGIVLGERADGYLCVHNTCLSDSRLCLSLVQDADSGVPSIAVVS